MWKVDYNWDKMSNNLNKCSIIWIKWYRSEITSVKFIKNGYKYIKCEKVDYNWNKIHYNLNKMMYKWNN
jgi:hypothetical protein